MPLYVKSLAEIATADRRSTRGPKVTAADLQTQLRFVGLPIGELEFSFHPTRKWRLDWALPERLLALEIEGVVYGDDYKLGGRHASRAGFKADTIKYAEAAILGYRLFRCLPSQITDGTALGWIERALKVTR